MTIYQRARSPYWHYDFVWKGKRYSGTTGCTSKADARAYEARIRNEAVLPTRQRPPITVDEAAGLYQEHAERQPSWKTTEYILAEMVRAMRPATLLADCTDAQIQKWVYQRRAHVSDSSVNRELDVWRAVWRRAERLKYDIGDMPDWNALRLAVKEKPTRELRGTEESALIPAIREDGRDCVEFALVSGWRLAEVIGLRWADVDLAARVARTRIKGGDVITRALTTHMVALIARQPKATPFVWTYVCQKTRADAEPKRRRLKGARYPMTKTALRTIWNAAREAVGLEDFRFHDLRHTRGSRIVRATGNLAAAQKALAHRNIRTTMRYVHVLDDDVRSALEASADAAPDTSRIATERQAKPAPAAPAAPHRKSVRE